MTQEYYLDLTEMIALSKIPRVYRKIRNRDHTTYEAKIPGGTIASKHIPDIHVVLESYSVNLSTQYEITIIANNQIMGHESEKVHPDWEGYRGRIQERFYKIKTKIVDRDRERQNTIHILRQYLGQQT